MRIPYTWSLNAGNTGNHSLGSSFPSVPRHQSSCTSFAACDTKFRIVGDQCRSNSHALMSKLEPKPGPTASKKIRMTMACERCRSKKVKCDFAHPSCTRCQQANVTCSYNGSSTQVDLFNLVKLNETVDMLQRRVQSIETDMKDVSMNTRYLADEFRTARATEPNNTVMTTVNRLITSSSPDPQWALSLTPNGLRIDTNIISMNALYDMLLTDISSSQRELVENASSSHSGCSHQSDASSQASSSSKTSILDATSSTITRKKELWKTRLKTFPVYSTWEPQDDQESELSGIVTKETRDTLMDIYSQCMLSLPCPDPTDSVIERYKTGTLDPLLMNAALCWAARHAAIHHNVFPGQSPNKVGEPFFAEAKELLKERFTSTDVDTMHSLLLMYIYAIGRPSSESEAYIYLGLAVRMCLDLKMYQEPTDTNPFICERNRRFFWAAYFFETLCTIHSDKTFSFPSEDMITVAFPTVMDHEKDEVRWRVEFITQRFRITRIYRNIIYATTQNHLLLSSISALDKELQDWYDNLIPEFKYTPGQDNHTRDWSSSSFREQACIKLNAEYNFQICQLYSLFASRSSDSQPSAIDLLARKRCLEAADAIVELLECFAQLNQRWCHFSLERPMVPAMLYNFFLSRNEGDCARHRRQLRRVANVLRSSPVKQHKLVITFTERIERLIQEQQVENLDLKDVTEKQQEEEQHHQQRQQQQEHQKLQHEPSVTPNPVLSSSDTPDASSPYFQHMIKEQQQHHPMVENPMEVNGFFCVPPSIGLCSTDGSNNDMIAFSEAAANYGPLDPTFAMAYYSTAQFDRWATTAPLPSSSLSFGAANGYTSPIPYSNTSAPAPLQPPYPSHRRLHDNDDIKGTYQYFG